MNILGYLSTVINNYEPKTLKDLMDETELRNMTMYVIKSHTIIPIKFRNINYDITERFIKYKFVLGSTVITTSANINTYYHILQGYYVFFSIESIIYWVVYDTAKRININLFELIKYLIEINYFNRKFI